jgi:hypothetical protein
MVTGRLNPNLDLDLTTRADDTLHPLDKLRQTRTIQREHERRDEPFTGRSGDKRHRHKLADIHRDQQAVVRVGAAVTGREQIAQHLAHIVLVRGQLLAEPLFGILGHPSGWWSVQLAHVCSCCRSRQTVSPMRPVARLVLHKGVVAVDHRR